jgi:hypothetical protein
MRSSSRASLSFLWSTKANAEFSCVLVCSKQIAATAHEDECWPEGKSINLSTTHVAKLDTLRWGTFAAARSAAGRSGVLNLTTFEHTPAYGYRPDRTGRGKLHWVPPVYVHIFLYSAHPKTWYRLKQSTSASTHRPIAKGFKHPR